VRGEASILSNLGSVYASMGNKGKAVKAFAQSRGIFAKLGLTNMVKNVE